MEQDYQGIDLKEVTIIILRKWWLIPLLFILCSGAAFFITDKYIEPIYEAETSLFLGKEEGDIAGFDISLSELQAYSQLIIDYRELSKTRMIIEQVIDNLQINMDVKTFRDSLFVDSIVDSRLFTIKFQHTNPKLAADVANAVAEQLIIKVTEIVDVQNIRVIDRAMAEEKPIKPNKLLNLTIAGVLGIMLAIFIIFVIHLLNNTVKDEKDIEKEFGLTVIGVIPLFNGEGR